MKTDKFVKEHWKKTIKLKNGWLLSLGFEDDEKEYYKGDYITEEQLHSSLNYMAKIINECGIPQTGSFFYDDDGCFKIREVEYFAYSKNIRINLHE